MTQNYLFHQLADDDLDHVVDYTRRQWGDAQATKYLAQLRVCIEKISAGEGQFTILEGLASPLRVVRCQHHFIFCLPREAMPALILAILHERMDVMARVAGRLE